MQHAAHVDLLQINSHCKLALTYMHACMATCVGPVHAYIFVGNLSQACQVPVDYLASEHVYRLINFDTSGLLKVFEQFTTHAMGPNLKSSVYKCVNSCTQFSCSRIHQFTANQCVKSINCAGTSFVQIIYSSSMFYFSILTECVVST